MRMSTIACLAGTLALTNALPARAVGNAIDVQVVDRSTGETLTPILHKGEWWVAGRPGARYGVTIVNRNGQRTLNVIAVDGVNAMSGDTAAWNQTGYVLDPYERTQIDGWRKNADQVAAFEFTALPDSYAARTGRPANVGVIGIAMFNEKSRPIARSSVAPDTARLADKPTALPMPAPAPPSIAEEAASDAREPTGRAEASKSASAPAQRDRLGTGHGEIEASSIRYVSFVRAHSAPDEIVTIHYDRPENLVALGILPAPPIASNAYPVTNPFPNSTRFVPDPPPVRR